MPSLADNCLRLVASFSPRSEPGPLEYDGTGADKSEKKLKLSDVSPTIANTFSFCLAPLFNASLDPLSFDLDVLELRTIESEKFVGCTKNSKCFLTHFLTNFLKIFHKDNKPFLEEIIFYTKFGKR
jgi:hypothetical protein